MLDMIRDTQTRFEEIALLLDSAVPKDNDYFGLLSEVTQQVYVTMNEEMCDSNDVCHECAKHRDFLYSIIPLLEELKEGTPLTEEYRMRLNEYRAMVKDVLTRISAILSAL